MNLKAYMSQSIKLGSQLEQVNENVDLPLLWHCYGVELLILSAGGFRIYKYILVCIIYVFVCEKTISFYIYIRALLGKEIPLLFAVELY